MLVAQSTPHEVIARAGLRTEALGCWVLYDSAGRRAQGSLYWAPAIAQLKSTRDSSRWKFSPMSRDALRIDSLGRDLSAIDDPRKRGWGFWSADSLSDSIRIGFSSGFSGTWFVFAYPAGEPSSDTLHGRAFEHWDFRQPTVRGSATAIRAACTK